jgi:hypothetical protein
MKSYLAVQGAQLLRNVQAGQIQKLDLTGSQVGSDFGFIPDDAATQAKGSVVLDKRNVAATVLQTLIVRDKMIFTVRLGQDLEFDFGNVLIFINNVPFLWMVFDDVVHKQNIDTVAHFAGDEYFLSTVFTYPYIRNLINFNHDRALHANFLKTSDMYSLPVANQVRAQQMVIEQHTLFYGRNQTIVAAKSGSNDWYASPLGFTYGETFKIDGGKTARGV